MCDDEENARAQDGAQTNPPQDVISEEAYRDFLAQWILLTPVYRGSWLEHAPESENYNMKDGHPSQSDKDVPHPWEDIDLELDRVLRARSQRYNVQVHAPGRDRAQRGGAGLIRSRTTTAFASTSVESESQMDANIMNRERSAWSRPAPAAAQTRLEELAYFSVAAGAPLELYDGGRERVQADAEEGLSVSSLSAPPSPLPDGR